MRLDKYMAEEYPEHSRAVWQKYIELGLVYVNGCPAYICRREVSEDDDITIGTLPVAYDTSDTLSVVYEDDHVVVVDKPSGVLTHAKGALTEEFSVAEFVRPRMNEPDDTNRPGIVHRLDRMTSGVLITAKDAATKRLLQKQFQDRKAHKTYLAVVSGRPKLDEARLDLPIERNPKTPSLFRVGAKGKPAVTRYKVLAANGTYSVVELRPETGRTHQLRVHMAYIGCPIVGDTVYGGPKSPIHRLCLHALELEITIPPSRRTTFRAPLPSDMQQLVEEIS